MILLSCPMSSISSNGNHTELCRLYRYKEYLRQEIVTDSGPQVVHLKYDVTIANSTRILDDMKGIQSVNCTNSSLTLILTSGLNASLMSKEFQLRSVVVGGREWGCLSSIVGEPATAMDFTRKVRSVSTDNNVLVLGTTDCNPFYAFEKQDIDIWSENVVTGSNLRSKSSADLPVSNTSSTRIDFTVPGDKYLTGEVFFQYEGFATSSATSTTTVTTTAGTTTGTTTVTGTTTTTATAAARISLSYVVDLTANFRFRIRAGLNWALVPTLYDYESWIDERLRLQVIAKATVFAALTERWTQEIFSGIAILAIPTSIGGVGVNAGLFGDLKMEMDFELSGMFQAEVGMVMSRTRKYGSRLSQSCNAIDYALKWFTGACTLVSIDEERAVSFDKIFDWGGRAEAVITPSVEFGLALKLGIGLGSVGDVGFEARSGLQLYLEATFKYGLGNLKPPPFTQSHVAEFYIRSGPETCQKSHEAEVKVEAGLHWTGLRVKLSPFYDASLIANRNLWTGKLFIACYDSGNDPWSVCASQYEQCSCPDGIVRYGASGVYAPIKEVITSTDCTNDVFGNPIPGVLKICECASCGSGKYLYQSVAASTWTCTDCPTNSNSPAGSAGLTSCNCIAGFPGPNGGPCTACVAGKYQSVTTATVTCSGGCLCQPSTGTSSGTISDGPGDYANNANCVWLIASSDSISLSFSSFNTESDYDYVTINRCTSSSSCVERVARLSSSSVSQSAIYTSSTGYMQVVFTSDNSVVRSGFVASWFVPCTNCPTNSNSPAGSASLTSCTCNAGFPGPNGGPCRGCVAGKYLSAATVTCSGGCLCQPSTGTSSGTISDGPSYYANNANCVWLIASEYGAVQLISSERKQTGKTEKGLTAHYLDRQTVDCNNEPIVGFGLERGRFSIRNVVRSNGNIDCNDQTFGDYSYSGNGKYCLCLLPGEGQTKNVCAAQDGVCTCPAGIVQYGHWDYAEIDYSYSCGLGGPFKDAVAVRDFLSFLSLIGLRSISLLIDTCSLCLPVPHGCRCKNKMEMRIFLHVI
jgi:hypothetical protein